MQNSYCAFLRGVNVKGTNMKMSEVCAVFEQAGMKDVSSVLASGNILFSGEKGKEELRQLLQKAMSEQFSYEAFLFIKNKNEVEAIVEQNPFTLDADYHVYAFAGVDNIAKLAMEAFDKCSKVIGEEAQIIASDFYWKVPKGNTLGSEFGKILGKKSMKNAFTSRNINTFEKVLKKMN